MAATISLSVKMLVAQTLTWGWGCRCEANTNVPGAPRILDPPLVITHRQTHNTIDTYTPDTNICDICNIHTPDTNICASADTKTKKIN